MMSSLLAPALALIAWTFVVWIWMFATRIPAMQKLRLDPSIGVHVRNLQDRLPAQVRAVGENYNHLHEQPTLFYALCIILHLLQVTGPAPLGLAWGYMVSRVVHSLVQNTSNAVPVRFAVFLVGSLLLMGLTGYGAFALLWG